MTAIAARLPTGRLHSAAPAGRGYRTACGRQLRGADLVVHVGRWAANRAWQLELTCLDCERMMAKVRRGRHKPGKVPIR